MSDTHTPPPAPPAAPLSADDLDAGREFMRQAWHQFNAIRAERGAPYGVSHDWWDGITEALGALLKDDRLPWMTGAARIMCEAAKKEGRDERDYELEVEREMAVRAQAQLSAGDYEEVLADHRRLVRELDVILNGEEGAAQMASLCDIVAQARSEACRLGAPVFVARAQAQPAQAVEGPCYRHKKRGTVYTVIGEAELQIAREDPVDGARVVLYRGEDGKLWARMHEEFHDGRFEEIAAPPHPPMPPERAAAERDAQHHAYLANEIMLQVCELPDRTSPADEPELLTITCEELRAIVLAALSAQQGGA